MHGAAWRFPRHLEFSTSTADWTQQLLFDQTPQIAPALPALTQPGSPETFYSDGFALLTGIPSAEEASSALTRFIAGIDPERLPLFARFSGRVQLAKVDRIPVCHDLVPRSFQALHYDMGQPIISPSTQTMYLFVGLYCPPEVEQGSAYTRVVSLRKLLSPRTWPQAGHVEANLIRYVRPTGDGWFTPRRRT